MTLAFLIAVIVVVWLAAFIIAYVYQLDKAKKRQAQTGQAINHGKILTDALGIACIAGLICCIAEGKAEAKSGGGGGGGDGGGNDVEAQQQPFMSTTPLSMPQPTMNWTPVNNAAADQVQG